MSSILQWKQKNIVTTDASITGPGVALWQKQGNNELKPIAFASRYLNDAEKNSIGELEVPAVVWGSERFRFHLYGKQVQLFFDHQALEPLETKQSKLKIQRAINTMARENKPFQHQLKS